MATGRTSLSLDFVLWIAACGGGCGGSSGPGEPRNPMEPVDPTNPGETTPYEFDFPAGFPRPLVPGEPPMTAEGVELGRHLFYERRLSPNETQSCGDCHQQHLSFTDGRAPAVGSVGDVRGGRLIEGGPNAGAGRLNPNKSGFPTGFPLSDAQCADVLESLTSLTDHEFLSDPRFCDPFGEAG